MQLDPLCLAIMSRKSWLVLVFLHIYYEDIAFGNLIVTQTPTELNPNKGDPARIICSWTIERATRIRVEWRRGHVTGAETPTVLSSLIWNIESALRPTQSSTNATTYSIANNTAMMTIDSVTEKDDGLYICEIIIETPMYNNGKGNGTILTVQQGYVTPTGQYLAILAIIGIVPVLALAGYCLYKRRTTANKKIIQKSEQDGMELNQVNGENIDADEDSAASSTQSVRWAVSIVYESVDYFAMKNLEDNAAACSAAHLTGAKTVEESCLTST